MSDPKKREEEVTILLLSSLRNYVLSFLDYVIKFYRAVLLNMAVGYHRCRIPGGKDHWGILEAAYHSQYLFHNSTATFRIPSKVGI